MRVKTYNKGGYVEGGFTSGGGTMTGPLILAADPTKDLEAVTKQYADSKLLSFDASKFTSGTLQVGRLPAFTGDVTSTTGSNSISLVTLGVSPGVYTKVTVNAKGLVTAGLSLSENDLPDLDWSKIISGKPTTLNGYGITDGLPKTGGTLSGTLTLSGDPTVTNQAATKQYVDSVASSFSALKSGDILTKMISITPAGFLRCNGGQVSKSTYSALYTVVGDVNSINANPGSGRPWQQQYLINNATNGDLTDWMASGVLPAQIGSSQAIVTKNRVYLLGGILNNSNDSNVIYTAVINADGTLGTWSNAGSLPVQLSRACCFIHNNRAYLLGGTNYGTPLNTSYFAPINSDGTLGAWTSNGNLLESVFGAQAIVTKNRVYLLAGSFNGSPTTESRQALINSDGTISAWFSGTALPISLSEAQVVVTKNRVYLIGGGDNSGTVRNTVLYATISNSGIIGTWTTDTALPGAVKNHQVIVTNNKVYVLGGYRNGLQSTVYYAVINADGTLGTWTVGTSLPAVNAFSQAIVVKNKVYLLGTNLSAQIYSASFNGGVSDYSAYYDGSIIVTSTNFFNLPDLTASDLAGSYSYIKI